MNRRVASFALSIVMVSTAARAQEPVRSNDGSLTLS